MHHRLHNPHHRHHQPRNHPLHHPHHPHHQRHQHPPPNHLQRPRHLPTGHTGKTPKHRLDATGPPQDLNPAPGRTSQQAQHTTPQGSEFTRNSRASTPPPVHVTHPAVHRPATRQPHRHPASLDRTCAAAHCPWDDNYNVLPAMQQPTGSHGPAPTRPPANPGTAGTRRPHATPPRIPRSHRGSEGGTPATGTRPRRHAPAPPPRPVVVYDLGTLLSSCSSCFSKIPNPKSTNLCTGSSNGAPIHRHFTNSKTKTLSRDRSIIQHFIHATGIRCFLCIHRLQCGCDCDSRVRCAAAVRSPNTIPHVRPRRGLIPLGGHHMVQPEEQAQRKSFFGRRHVLGTEA